MRQSARASAPPHATIPSAADAPSMKRPEHPLTPAAAITRCGPCRGLRGGGLRGRGGAGPLLLAGGLARRRHGLPAVRRHRAQALRAVQRREGEGARWRPRALSRCAASWNAHGADACVLSPTTLHHHHDNARAHARALTHTHTHTHTRRPRGPPGEPRGPLRRAQAGLQEGRHVLAVRGLGAHAVRLPRPHRHVLSARALARAPALYTRRSRPRRESYAGVARAPPRALAASPRSPPFPLPPCTPTPPAQP